MLVVERINRRFGRGSIHVGRAVGECATGDWSVKQERLTTKYTTKWSGIHMA
jgi:hypothetical protein